MKISTVLGSLLALGGLVGATAASAAPAFIVTAAEVNSKDVLLSFDFVAEEANPVAVIVAHIGLKNESKKLQLDLSKCSSGAKGSTFGGCSTNKGDLVMLIDGSGDPTPLASAQLGSVRVPKAALDLNADGTVKVSHLQFTAPSGKDVASRIESDHVGHNGASAK